MASPCTFAGGEMASVDCLPCTRSRMRAEGPTKRNTQRSAWPTSRSIARGCLAFERRSAQQIITAQVARSRRKQNTRGDRVELDFGKCPRSSTHRLESRVDMVRKGSQKDFLMVETRSSVMKKPDGRGRLRGTDYDNDIGYAVVRSERLTKPRSNDSILRARHFSKE